MQHVVIFARVPRLGTVKRRLARGIGDLAAFTFYRDSLKATIRKLDGDPRWRLWIAWTPDSGADATRHIGILPQGQGDLGRRMRRAFDALPSGPAIVVGSDVPALGASHVAAAFRELGRRDFVFGPASDGGYWLVGSKRLNPLPRGLFRGVRWSSEHALADTLAGLGDRNAGFLATLDDIDDAAAWERHRKRS